MTAALYRMTATLRRAVGWIRSRVIGRIAPIAATINSASAVAATDDTPGQGWGGHGVWSLKADLLDRLSHHFNGLRRVRAYDPSSYSLVSRMGLAIPNKWYHDSAESVPRPVDGWPHFCGIVFPHRQVTRGDLIQPHLAYAVKLRKPPAYVEQADGECYRLVLLYDDPWASRKWAAIPVACHVRVGRSWEQCRLLKERRVRTVRVQPRAKRKHSRRPDAFNVAVSEWAYPEWLRDVAGERQQQPSDVAIGLLGLVLGTYLMSMERIIIRVSSGALTALFGIDLKTAPRFFADRDTEVAVDGKRKRIFHSVSAHTRAVSGVGAVDVKAHYRGLRSFRWGGYGIHIVAPANKSVLAFPGAADEALDDVAPTESVLGGADLAGLLWAEASK